MPDTAVSKDATALSAEEDEELLSDEKWWRDRYEMLEKRGYRLRPRYQPGWIPSWLATGRNPIFCEDHIWNRINGLMDATRIKDGKVVSLKRIIGQSQELSIALFLSPTSADSSDLKNHCVPILDHFSDEVLPHFSFLVMPLLRRFNDPPFYAVEEVVDFVKQTLEGLSYMHSRGVAHRDCANLNIMLEASSLYPQGFHPVARVLDPTGEKRAVHRRRRDVQGVKYYFIDFGISTRFDMNADRGERLVTGIHCQDREVPELSNYVPYDPFAVDVFTLGNLYRRKLLDNYSNLAFLSELASSMTAAEPEKRPTVDEALALFDRVVATQPRIRLRWRLKQKDAGIVRRIFVDFDSAAREGVYVTRRLITLPISLLRK